MRDSLLIRFVFFFLGLLLFVSPTALQSAEIDSFEQETDPVEIVESSKQMTQKQINDLFGEDPYLGQTSYLQSPDGYSQRETSQK